MNQNEVYDFFLEEQRRNPELCYTSAQVAEILKRPGARRQVLKLYAAGFLEVLFVKKEGGGFEPRYRMKPKKEAKP